jgi:plasmid stabilization system protein ParE
MSARYVLAPEAALDLVQIWRYLKKQNGVAVADRVESVIRDKIVFLAKTPGRRTLEREFDGRGGQVLPSLFLSHRLPARDKALAGGLHLLHGYRNVALQSDP